MCIVVVDLILYLQFMNVFYGFESFTAAAAAACATAPLLSWATPTATAGGGSAAKFAATPSAAASIFCGFAF